MSDTHLMQNAKGRTNSPAQAEFDPTCWALLNPWLSEGQPDDRTPMNGSVKNSGEHHPFSAPSPGGLIRRCSKSGRKRGTTTHSSNRPPEKTADRQLRPIWRNSVRSTAGIRH
jgi:hypothetical protein